MTKSTHPDFSQVYDRLAGILKAFSGESLHSNTSEQGMIELVGPPSAQSKGKDVWFGGVRLGKNYVSYYLMPVYACPDLLGDISPELRKHMQGKSCFNFSRVDDKLFQELAELTQRGYERYKEDGWIE